MKTFWIWLGAHRQSPPANDPDRPSRKHGLLLYFGGGIIDDSCREGEAPAEPLCETPMTMASRKTAHRDLTGITSLSPEMGPSQ